MSFKRIMLFFYIGIPVCTLARVLQIIKTVEYENGFFISGQRVLGIALTVVIALVCAVVAFLSNRVLCNSFEKSPKNNVLLSVFSLFTAASLFAEAFYQAFPITVAPWQMGTIRLITVICSAYFVLLGVKSFVKIKIAPAVHIIPIAYAIIKTVFTFIGVSSLALISDNVLLMAAYSLLMLFFINYGKFYNRLDKERNFRKILWTGLATSLICISQSAAYFLVNIIGKEKYLHSDVNVIYTLFFIGMFILFFVLSPALKPKNKKSAPKI